jgi:hypothetical protein
MVHTHSSHLNDHLNVRVPVNLISTTEVGLQSSNTFTLLVALGEVAVMRSDSAMGSKSRLIGHGHITMSRWTHRRPRFYKLDQRYAVSDNAQHLTDRPGLQHGDPQDSESGSM